MTRRLGGRVVPLEFTQQQHKQGSPANMASQDECLAQLEARAQELLVRKNYGPALGVLGALIALSPNHPFNGFYQMLLRWELLKAQGLTPVGPELAKTYEQKLRSGFFQRWLSGPNILDVGYRGNFYEAQPVLPHATGVDFGTLGYDGRSLPFADQSQDGVFSCHCLEHVGDIQATLRDWMRVLRIGGHLVVIVPHQHLYEKRRALPSRWNADHKRFLTPAKLLAEVEAALPVNSYRIRHLVDNDFNFDYQLGPESHSSGNYEIEMVLEKLVPPQWELA